VRRRRLSAPIACRHRNPPRRVPCLAFVHQCPGSLAGPVSNSGQSHARTRCCAAGLGDWFGFGSCRPSHDRVAQTVSREIEIQRPKPPSRHRRALLVVACDRRDPIGLLGLPFGNDASVGFAFGDPHSKIASCNRPLNYGLYFIFKRGPGLTKDRWGVLIEKELLINYSRYEPANPV